MLTLDSTFIEFEEAQKTVKLMDLFKQVGIGQNKFRKMLNLAGYKYVGDIKKWVFEPLNSEVDYRHLSIRDFEREIYQSHIGKTGNTKSNIKSNMGNIFGKKNSNTSNMNNTEVVEKGNISNTHITKIQDFGFTPEEILFLKDFIKSQHDIKNAHNTSDILDIINALSDTKESIRRTYVLDKAVSDEMDAFCERLRIKKTDFLTIALIEALAKYK